MIFRFNSSIHSIITADLKYKLKLRFKTQIEMNYGKQN